MFWDFLVSYGKGSLLGGSVVFLSSFLDRTICNKSMTKLLSTAPALLLEAYTHSHYNLMLVSPIVYSIVDNTLLSNVLDFSLKDCTQLLFIQNIGYFIAHYCMHKNLFLYKYHSFHHKFDSILIPTIGNAVSTIEFLFAYTAPFVVGAYYIRPSELSFLASIGVVSVGNMVIHMEELRGVWWLPGFVSPTNHIEHHEKRNCHYSAPLINFDWIADTVQDLLTEN